MPDFKIQTGNIADALTDFDAPALTGPIQTPESVIMPTAEEQARFEAEAAQEQAENKRQISAIIASGVPVMRKKTPDLLTTPTMTGNLNWQPPQEAPEWQKTIDSLYDKGMDIYRNLFNNEAHVLQDAQKYAPYIGVSAQYLMDHPDEMDRAKLAYARQDAAAFMPRGVYYSPQTLDKLYPELIKYRQKDPVGTAQALRNYQDVHETRDIFESLADTISDAGEFFTDAFNSGSDMVKLYDAQMQAVKTGNVEAARPEVDAISKRLADYQKQEPDTALGKIVYAAIQQLTVYGTQGMRALQYVPKSMAMAMTVAAPAAAAAGSATLGSGAAAILAAAGATGATWGLRVGLLEEFRRQSMAQRYWEMAQQRDDKGRPMYSRRNMLADSMVVGAMNSAIELGLLEFGYAPIKAVFGKNAAQTILRNGAAQRKIVDAGKKAIAQMALRAGAVQYARTVGSELAEEGAQSVVGDMATNIEYAIHGKGAMRTTGDVLNNALDAMVEAVPAAIGLGGLGAGVRTVGQYNAMSHISGLRLEAWREEYRRNIEAQTLAKLVENRETSKLAKEAPDVYRKVVQAQAERVGMETTYVDAQEALRKDGGAEALNDLVVKDIITEDELHQAITMGTPVEVDTATYTQMADPQTIQTLNDVSTMNKGGVHLRALKERNKRMEAIRKEFEDLASAKSDALSAEIMADHFADADDVTQAAAQDVVYRNPYDLGQSYRDALKEAREAYETAIDFNYYWTYKGDGVKVITSDANGYNNTQTGRGYRMSENEPWYSKMYKDYGGRATREQMLDVAYQDQRAEIAASAPEKLAEWDDTVQAAKQKYETLRDMATTFETLARSDYGLRKTFSKEGAKVYDEALQVFQAGNRNVAQAAKENAFIYARMAERMAQIQRDAGKEDYTALDFAKAHPIRVGGKAVQKGKSYGQPYVNADGTPNYGIYFGDNKTGGVLYIEPQAFTQMAGPRSQTAALDTLADAQRRFDAGEDADAIYQDTGWVRGQDGRWRYEIPDDINAIDFGDRSASTLGQVYDNPRLYEAYPELRDMPVYFADTSYGGGYDTQAITLNAAYTDRQAKEALIHEVQHAIQDIEGFAVGGSPDTVQQQIAYEMGKMSRELWDVSPDGPAYVDAYTSEFNAMLAGDMTAYAEAHSTRMELEKNLPKEAWQKIHTLNGLIKRLEKEWQKLDEGQSPVESYRRLHGEQEARKTAERAVQPGEANANTWQYPDPVIVFNGSVFTQRAWHGSPYEFEAFDLGAMGSGEGNQAHGWGLYFAGNKEVSEIYKEYFGWKGDHVQLNGLEYVKNRDDEWLDNTGEIIDDDTPLGFAIDALREAGTIEHAIESLNESIKNMEKRKKRMKTEKSKQYADDHIRTASQAITILQNGNGGGMKGGRLYEVEVPEQEVLLDEQKTYEEQSPYVKERLDKVIKELNDEQVERDRHDAIQAIEQLRYRSVNNITKMVNVYKSALRRLGYPEETAQKVAESDAERDKAIQEANTRYDELKANPERLLQGRKGREIYRYLSEARSIRGDKNASLLLNENGIKGITYEGKSDGRCYVVFDDAAIQIIDRYNQSVQAAYNASTGILHLFDTADQSSFIHEAGHLWLSELELMAARGDAPSQIMEDLQTIRQWGAYAPEQLDDYTGTEREAEFRQYAADIESARQSGDAVAIQAAEERWMQERFARAFERYIAEGKAPVKELQSPFRRFRKWLVGIYRDLKNLGKEPPADVKRVMDRMVATDEEIEAWAKMKELNAWDRKGFSGDLSGDEGRMIAEWNEKIKADAKEKLLSQYMKDIEAEDAESLQAGLEAERIKVQEELCSENELYEYDLLYDENPDMRAAILDKLGFADEAEFKQALRNIGGTLEERTNAYMQDVSEAYVPLSPEEIRRDADERLASTDGQLALNDLEARAMNRKIKSYISECVKALREVENVSGTDAEIAAQLRKLLGVETKKDKEKAVRGELRNIILSKNDQIDALKKRLAEEKETGKATQESNEQTIRSLKNALNETIRGLNRARDSVQGSYVAMLRLAREQLDEQPVSDATTWRHFEIKANTANHRADQLMSAGEFEQAVLAKGEAQRFYCLSRAAKDNQDFVRKAMQGENGRLNEDQQEIDGMMGIINRVERADKPARMNPHARYFIERLAYNAKLKDRPPRPPLDEAGNPVSLDWETIYQKLSPDYAQDKNTAPPVDEIVAPWLRQLIDGKDQVRYQDLTMAQFRDINEAIRVVYKMGRQDYETVSIVDANGQNVDLENAVAQLVGNMPRDPSWDPQQEKNNQTFRDRAQERAADAVLDLTRSEVILQNMGPQWVQYVYRPIDKGANRELEMREEALKEFSRIHNIYSKREWYDIRNKKDYVLGGWTKVTKEQLLVLALNWGNKEGRQRVLDELNRNVTNIDQEYSEVDVEDAFSRYLTDKDLDYVEAVWAQLAQYWPERNKVQERLYGVGLGRVQPRPFTINGRKVSGGYYPIVYDSALSNRTNELELDDIARSMMSGSSTMALGMGSTKKRVAVVKNQTILKSLDVWPSAVNEAIHHICMREAVTDVNKLMSNADVERAIQENYGMQTYSTLKKWVSDCWKTDVQKQDDLSRALEIARRNTSFAVMAFRTGPAVLNALNIFPMMKQIGVLGTKQALSRFGLGIFNMGTATYHANRDFVMAHSPFMRERANTIDRDLQQAMRISVDAGEISRKVSQAKQFRDEVNRYGYKFITETDLMFSMAMWKYKYDETMRQQIDEGKTDEAVMRDNAVFAADKAVRDVLGSGMVKDQVAMQRKGGFISQLTPFYSYSSTVLNALIHAGYQWRAGNRWEMMNAMLFWIVLPTIFETLYRSAVADEDDPEKILKRLGVGLVTSTTQGIPIVRDALEVVANHIFDMPNYSNNNVLGLSLVEEIGKAFSAATSENKDATDVGRSATRAVNRIAKLPDTLTDGFWALMRFSLYDTDRSVAELATAVIFDKRYRTAAERAKAEKKKQREANKK